MKLVFLMLLTIGSSSALMSCADITSRAPIATVPSVDLARYAGTWYEIARLPMWFQRHCLDSSATYSLRADGTIGVHNECVTNNGRIERAEGIATVVDQESNARLTVTFDNWFAKLFGSSREGNYWILDLDADYRTAIVGTPDRRHLWILARTPVLDDATYQDLVTGARQMGFPVSDLIRAKRPTN
jgi:apolipoprotein D and lipocalin family protein